MRFLRIVWWIVPIVTGASISSVAHAQSAVTLYGIADANLRFDHTNIGTLRSVDSGGESGSRWGIRGIEDLGNGLRATFIFEQGIDLSDGSNPQGNIGGNSAAGYGGSSTTPHSSTGSRLFSRLATVGIAGDFGEVRFGRAYTPVFLIEFGADPYGAGTVAGVTNVFVNNFVRNDNAIYYDTPKIANAQGIFSYQAGESTTDDRGPAATGQARRGNDRLGAGIRYVNGPIYVGAGYEHIKSNLDVYHVSTYDVAASYDLSLVKLHAIFWRTRNDNLNPTPAIGNTNKLSERSYFLAATVPFGAWDFIGSFGRLRDNSTSNLPGVNLGTPRANLYGGLARYSLSKRTVLYASYARFQLKNGPNNNAFQGFQGLMDASNVGLYNTANLNGPTGQNVNPWSYQIGIRHVF